MNVVTLPARLEERTFDAVVQALNDADPGEARVLFDARRVRWVDPYGMIGLLAAGATAARGQARPALQLPQDEDVVSYLARMGFFDQASEVFDVHDRVRRASGGASDVLLEVTPVRSHGDVHTIVDRVQDRIAMLARQLNYPAPAAAHFSVILAEVCQNIVEHARADGWVASQTYHWKRRLGRRVAVIAVMDLGIGFRGSLASEHAARYGERWNDATALEAAFIHGLTRFHDPGRGHGLQQIRKQVGRFGGKISIRSGTARIADVPEWDDAPPLAENLPPFPGAQIGIVLPERVEADDD